MDREPIMQFFKFDHLPAEKQAVSKPFGELAELVHSTLPRNPERTVALRKLLEAKDAAVRAGFMVMLALFVFAALPAFAQDIPAPAVPPAPSVGLQLGGALLDLLMAALVAGIGMLAAYLRTKAAESRAAKVGLVVTEAARAAVLELDRSLKPKLQAALADGVLTDKEKAELKQAAMDLLKGKLPAGLLGTASQVFGAFTDTYLSGKIEQAVAEKNAIAAQAEPVPPSP